MLPRRDTSRLRVRKIILLTLVGITILGFVFTAAIDEYFYRTCPRIPDPGASRIYLRNVHHGAYVYLTLPETIPLDYFILWMLFFIAAIWLNNRWRCYPPSR
jgi:hypothetical protein